MNKFTTIEEIEAHITELAKQRSGAILMDLLMPDAGDSNKINWNINCTTCHLIDWAKTIAKFCVQEIDSAIKHQKDLLVQQQTIKYKDEYIRQNAIESTEIYIEGMEYGADIVRDIFDWDLTEKYERKD